MQTKWFSNLKTKAEQEDFKQLVNFNTKLLDRLREILYNVVKDGELISVSDYDSPSWAAKQADRNGYLRAHKEFIDLLTITDKEH